MLEKKSVQISSPSEIKRRLPELRAIEQAVEKLAKQDKTAKIEVLAEVTTGGHRFPIHAVTLGPSDPRTPVLGFFGGVHGLEKIGTQLCTSYMQTITTSLEWDEQLHDYLRKARLVFVPLINPGGMFLGRRSNPQGVDLMRNAPVEAERLARFKLLSGHRLSPHLPWYRGKKGRPMEVESAAICAFAQKTLFPATCVITLDIHSGFGVRDRLWFPYAKAARPFPNLTEMYALVDLFERTFPHNVYKIEPQSKSYTTHGDLWDYLYEDYRTRHGYQGLYLPLCLELGSWLWVKKNPKQLLSLLGAFNPVVLHRHQRTMRRHLVLFDFLRRVVLTHQAWAQPDEKKRLKLYAEALDMWYPNMED